MAREGCNLVNMGVFGLPMGCSSILIYVLFYEYKGVVLL